MGKKIIISDKLPFFCALLFVYFKFTFRTKNQKMLPKMNKNVLHDKFYDIIAESFYNVKYRLAIITAKGSQKISVK